MRRKFSDIAVNQVRANDVLVTLLRLVIILAMGKADAYMPSSTQQQGMIEWTVDSHKSYADPFNDVDVDVIFTNGTHSWRVPMFWRGKQQWTVRFAPPVPGTYGYILESTDKTNPDLNGHHSYVTINAYSGSNPLLAHGFPRVSANKRYFEFADGTPFSWLGDTWWSGLSSRLPWEGFKRLTADRASKGFTVVQIVAGLVPVEETCPMDPGCANEGGPVWTKGFERINPLFFDYADRRIAHLVDAGIVPAIVGAWSNLLDQMDVAKIKKHWRYIIARYGAYPVFWIVGGEVFDPPEKLALRANEMLRKGLRSPGAWTEVAGYIRATDPYHHPVSVHELSPDDPPLQQEVLTDFRLLEPMHFDWASIAVEVAQLDLQFSRIEATKPLVVGEIGYEMLGGIHLQDFQRTAFWLAMLNGAAGFTYGAAGTWESYTADKPFQRTKWSFLTWEEGMNLPGSYQIGLGARLLRRYPWWRFMPHPEWVSPRGTTLFEPRDGVDLFHIDLLSEWGRLPGEDSEPPVSEWKKKDGNFRLPYAAGIPGQVRIVYMPYFGIIPREPLTVFGLEQSIRYRAYYWEPSLGIKVDLGTIEHPEPGKVIFSDDFSASSNAWTHYGTSGRRDHGSLLAGGHLLSIVKGVSESSLVTAADAFATTNAGLLLGYRDAKNYLTAVYSADDNSISLLERKDGIDGPPLGRTTVTIPHAKFRLTAEVQNGLGIVSLSSGDREISTPIVTLGGSVSGSAGLTCICGSTAQHFQNFEVRRVSVLTPPKSLPTALYDATGTYRGTLPAAFDNNQPPNSQDTAADPQILLDAYRPRPPPILGDWVLVLDTDKQ